MARRIDRPGGGWPGPVVGLVLLVAATAGCPTYEDSYSGTYREQSPNPAASDRGRQSVQVDFFRYGDHAKAILRYFRPGSVYGDPFGTETFCTWTRADADAFGNDSRRFRLPVEKSTKIPNGRLDGEIIGDQTMDATLYNTDSGEQIWETITLERKGSRPNPNCEGIEEFLVRPTFDLANRRPNRLPEETDYDIQHPVLTVQWVSFRRESGARTNRTLVRVGDQGWAERLSKLSTVSFRDGEFGGSPAILLSPPPDKILSDSGSTQFAVGHVVVVDDSTGEGRFRWSVDTEPIVASALQNGVLPGDPASANASGKAILYVEGDIQDLADDLGNFQDEKKGLQPRLTGLQELEESEVPDRSFFVADVAVNVRDHLIVQMDVKPRVTQTSIPIQATDRYLNEGFAPLPRLLP